MIPLLAPPLGRVERIKKRLLGSKVALKEPFHWQPLDTPDDIRLLEVLPSQKVDEILRCRLISVNDFFSWSAQPFAYQAISHVWNAGGKLVTIEVDEKPCSVTRNVSDVLHELRRDHFSLRQDPLRVWIDVVCINQEDLEERNAQVRQMAQIFYRAHEVVIWLGLDEQDSSQTKPEPGLSSVFQVLEILEETRSYARHAAIDSMNIDFAQPLQQLENAGNRPIRLLSRFVSHLWFTRVWCIQEAVLAQRAVFAIGPRRMPFPRADLLNSGPMVRFLQSQQISVKYKVDLGLLRDLWVKINNINHFQLSHMRPILPCHLPTILNQIRSQKCTDERDRMFGVMGLFEEPHFGLVRVDYAEPVELLYARIVDNYILEFQDLTILSFAESTITKVAIEPELCLPSWCPNWTEQLTFIRRLCLGRYTQLAHKTRLNATAGVLPHVSVDGDLGVMTITGARVASVQARTALLDTFFQAGVNTCAGLQMEIIKTSEEAGIQCEWTKWRALIWNTMQADLYDEWSESTGWIESRISRATQSSGQVVPNADLNDEELIKFLREAFLSPALNHRRLLFIDKAPYLALGPAGTQLGDTVCALFGGECLYVLGDRKGKMNFIGECYVQGLMDGEVMEALDRGEYTAETFELY